MSIQAIIMAGGAGTRLRPLTCDMPKPLAPLCGAPIMDYSLQLLKKHGFGHADVTLWYKPDDVQACFGAGRRGVSLSYVVEDIPVGTAGSVLLAAPEAKDTVLVLSGDGLTSADLTAAIAFHRQRKAAATLILQHVDIPLPYGVVVTDPDGRIRRFIEKPDWSRVISSLVNTGVYLLEPEALALIPPDKPFDFGKELFPLMLEKGLPLYGYTSDAYWCDVGDPAAFLKAQGDLLAGRTGFSPVDYGQRQAEGASISADSYVAPDARIGPGATVRGSCVLGGAVIGGGAQLDGTIVCARARVEEGAALEKGSVLGAGASAGAFSTLRGQAHIWPGIRLADDAMIDEAVRQPMDAAVSGGRAAFSSPAQLACVTAAFLGHEDKRNVAVMRGETGAAAYHTALGALSAYGTAVLHGLGRGTLGMLAYAVRALNADGGVLCGDRELLLVDRHGLLCGESACAAIQAAARRQELPAQVPRPVEALTHASMGNRYAQTLARRFFCPRGVSVSLRCADPFLHGLARTAFALAGHTVREHGDVALHLDAKGARILTPDGPLSPIRQWQLVARALEKDGKTVYDTGDFGIGEAPYPGSEACREQMRLTQDALAVSLLLLRLFTQEPLREALADLPEAAQEKIAIPCKPERKGSVLEALLSDAVPRAQGGLASRRGDAQAVIRPDPLLPLMHVAVSARSAETAAELCDFYAGRVLRAMHERT